MVEGLGAFLSFLTSGAYPPSADSFAGAEDDVLDEVLLEAPPLCGVVPWGTVVGVLVVLAGPLPAPGAWVPGEAGYCDPLGY